jgi:hypothetical protein
LWSLRILELYHVGDPLKHGLRIRNQVASVIIDQARLEVCMKVTTVTVLRSSWIL